MLVQPLCGADRELPDARKLRELAEMLGPERAEREVHIRVLFSEPP